MEIPKEIGHFVRDNKLASIIFGIVSLTLRMGSSEAEASETNGDTFEVPDDVLAHENIPDNIENQEQEVKTAIEYGDTIDETAADKTEKIENTEILKNIEEITENAFVDMEMDTTDNEKDVNVEISRIATEINEQKNQSGTMFQGIHSGEKGKIINQESSIDTNLLMENVKENGEVKLHVLSLTTRENKTASNELTISLVDDSHETENNNVRISKGIGDTENEAIISAIQECASSKAIFVHSEIESSTVAHNDSCHKSFSENSKQASDQIINITGIEVREETITIGGEERIVYFATVTSK